MALPTNLFSAYDVRAVAGSANKEAVFETIQNIVPWDTPFYSSAPKVSVGNVTFDWLTDVPAATSDAGTAEGEIITAIARFERSILDK